MRFLGAVLLLISVTTSAVAENPTCGCEHARLPLFERDPLVFPDNGQTAYVTPGMVHCNEAGEPAVKNASAFFEGEPMSTFEFEGMEFGKILVYNGDDFTTNYSTWMNLEELNDWALKMCPQAPATS